MEDFGGGDTHTGAFMISEAIRWRRLDAPGHDACRLRQSRTGWQLDGAAAFRHGGTSAQLTYRVACDRAWRTLKGAVSGWIGQKTVELIASRRADGQWTLNGAAVSHLDGCLDLDLGFTPATNLFQLRRLALDHGEGADVPVAWLDVAAGTLDVLHQRYERRRGETYWYEAPRFDYAALLESSPIGFVRRYPGLWEAEPDSARDRDDH